MAAFCLRDAEAAGYLHGELSVAADHRRFHFLVFAVLVYPNYSIVGILTVDT